MIDEETGKSGRRVIARIHPLSLGTLLFFSTIVLVFLVSVLNQNGWLNPEAFANRDYRRSFLLDIPFAGHALTAVTAYGVAYFLTQFASLAAHRFDDVIFDGKRFYYASKPWMGKIPLANVSSARIIEPRNPNAFTGKSNEVEIFHAQRSREGKVVKSIILSPWLYRESVDEIVANLEACGIRVRPLPTGGGGDAPIWDRKSLS